jgi:hypothetical protein
VNFERKETPPAALADAACIGFLESLVFVFALLWFESLWIESLQRVTLDCK